MNPVVFVMLQALIDYTLGPGLFLFSVSAALHLTHKYL